MSAVQWTQSFDVHGHGGDFLAIHKTLLATAGLLCFGADYTGQGSFAFGKPPMGLARGALRLVNPAGTFYFLFKKSFQQFRKKVVGHQVALLI